MFTKILLIAITYLIFPIRSSSEADSENIVISLNFETLLERVVKKPDDPFLILFHSPNCPHCLQFRPIFLKLAKENSQTASFAEINCMNEAKACRMIKINAYPMIYLFKNGHMYKFEEKRSETAIVEFMENGYKNATALKIPTEMPTVFEDILEAFEEIKEEVTFTFYGSDDLLPKVVIAVLLLMICGLCISIFYFFISCLCLICTSEPTKKKEKND